VTRLNTIITETEYEAALVHFETLMDAEPNSPQEEELERLAILVEEYEREHYPIADPDPIEAAKFRMEQQGSTQKLSTGR
jgi:HTH-type transcriptional regulator/antitoxin HigA